MVLESKNSVSQSEEVVVFCWTISMPCFSKGHLAPLRFYKRPTLVLIFTNKQTKQKNPKNISALKKSENSVQFCFLFLVGFFAANQLERQCSLVTTLYMHYFQCI